MALIPQEGVTSDEENRRYKLRKCVRPPRTGKGGKAEGRGCSGLARGQGELQPSCTAKLQPSHTRGAGEVQARQRWDSGACEVQARQRWESDACEVQARQRWELRASCRRAREREPTVCISRQESESDLIDAPAATFQKTYSQPTGSSRVARSGGRVNTSVQALS